MNAPPSPLSVQQENIHRPNTESVIYFKSIPTNIQIHPTQKTPVASKFKMLISTICPGFSGSVTFKESCHRTCAKWAFIINNSLKSSCPYPSFRGLLWFLNALLRNSLSLHKITKICSSRSLTSLSI